MVYHEYAHGLTERLVTDAQGFGALIGAQPGAIAEGTSDFYAIDFLVQTEPGLVPTRRRRARCGSASWLQADLARHGAERDPHRGPGLPGAATGPRARARRSRADDAGGYDYGDFGRIDGAPRGARRRRDLGADAVVDPHRADHRARPAEGLERARAYVTGGLRLAPEDPTFLDMRNAIVQAASTRTAATTGRRSGTSSPTRGMGWSASTEGPNDTSPSRTTTRRAAGQPVEPRHGRRDAVARRGRRARGGRDGRGRRARQRDLGATQLSSPRPTPSGRYALGRRAGRAGTPTSTRRKAGVPGADAPRERRGRRHDVKDFNPLRRDYGLADVRRLGHAPTGRTSARTAAARPRRSTTTSSPSGARPRTRARTTCGRPRPQRRRERGPDRPGAGCGDDANARARRATCWRRATGPASRTSRSPRARSARATRAAT